MTGDRSWSLGILAGLPVVVLVLLVALAVVVFGIRYERRDTSYDDGTGYLLAVIAGIVLVVMVGVLAVGFYPYRAEYHQWRTTSGTVTAIDSRLLGDSDSTTQRFVVTLDGVGQRACDDTRCASVKPGDVLTLSCKREWQFTGTDGYGCNFIEVVKP